MAQEVDFASVTRDPRLASVVAAHPYPLLFATISGAHLYGFPSTDSDYDLRGAHLLPLRELVGLGPHRETVQASEDREGLELDLVTHEAGKFFRLLLKPNGYVLEQLYSPLVVQARPEHEELKAIARACITKRHAAHYFGFAASQWRLFAMEEPRRVKPLLYVFRVLLTGIHLMRTGEVEANLVHLNDEARLPCLVDLIARKTGGPEKATLSETDFSFFEGEYWRLWAGLEEAEGATTLPERETAREALNDLLLRLRLG